MSYDVIRLAADKLSYREKMKLAQYLIQSAIKEEEELRPESRTVETVTSSKKQIEQQKSDEKINTVEYIKERLLKSKPSKKQSLSNFINAVFQFQGGITASDVETLIAKLIKEKFITIDGSKVIYK